MHISILILALFIATIEWVAVGKNWRKIEYFAKPSVMIVLIIWLALMGGTKETHLLWFFAGAVFSLFGDVFLLRDDKPTFFLLGLVSFLIAHVTYVVAFNNPIVPINIKVLIVAGLIIAFLFVTGRQIISGVQKKGWDNLRWPIITYIIVIGTMLFSALSKYLGSDWNILAAVLVGLGAISFTLSDLCLAWNKFVSPIKYGRIILMITYHLGQAAILGGAVLQFS